MVRAVTLGMKERRNTSPAAIVMLLGALLLSACSSGGKDRDFELPAGDELDSARSDKVLVVVEALNECDRDGSCASVNSPCDLGNGNSLGLALYRLGNTGLLLRNSPDGAAPEQVIGTGDNPRRVVVHPNDPTTLYVAIKDRVQVIRVRPGGGSACIDETTPDDAVKPDAQDSDPVDMVIDPTIGNGILYVAGRGSDRIDAYPIADDGTLPRLPSSCIVGGGNAEFTSLAPLGEGFFAAGGSVRIETHPRVQGQFLPEPDFNATPTPTPAPVETPSPAPGETPGPSDPTPQTTTCIDARLVSTPLSAIGSGIVTQLLFRPSASKPLGDLFIAEEASERIFTFAVDADGNIDDDDDSSTNRAGTYQRMLPHQHSGANILYSTVFNEGRIDAFQLEPDGRLPDESFSRTAEDPNTLPVGLVIDEPNGTILYVSQAGLHRIDGFRIRPDGGLPDEPATSSAPRVNASGDELETFPDDVAIIQLP